MEALVCIEDRDCLFSEKKKKKKEIEGEHLSEEMEELIEKRGTYVVDDVQQQDITIVTKPLSNAPKSVVLSSIMCNGDCQGAVILLEKNGKKDELAILKPLASAAANFLGKTMEQ